MEEASNEIRQHFSINLIAAKQKWQCNNESFAKHFWKKYNLPHVSFNLGKSLNR
jgi:hypothetical protein